VRRLTGSRAGEPHDARRESIEFLALEYAPIGMALVDPDGRWLHVNRAVCEITGYSDSQLRGLTSRELTHPDDVDADRRQQAQLLTGDIRSYRIEQRCLRRDGSVVWVRLYVSLAQGDAAEAPYLIVQIEDISAERKARRALAQSEALLSAIIEHAPAGIMVRGVDGRYLRGNAYAAETLGVPTDQIPGRTPEEFFPAEVAREIRDHDAAVLESGMPVSEELTVKRASGTQRTYESLKYPIRDAAGEIVGLGSFALDITEQKRVEERYRDAQALARFGSWELDVSADRLRWSDELCNIVGVPLGTAPTYEEFVAYVHPDDRAALRAAVQGAWEGSFSASEYRIVRPDGEIRHVHMRRFGRRDDDGTVVELWGTTQDITERVLAEESLRSARERSLAIISGMREGYALTIDGQIIEINDSLCRLTGFSREELVGARMPFPFWPPHLRDDTLAARDRVLANEGGTFEVTLQRKDGSLFDGEIVAQPARNADGSLVGFVNTLRDISEAKRHRAELEHERTALREAQQLARLGSWDYDIVNNRPGRWSTELWRILALEPQQVAPPLEDFMAMIHPDDRERIAAQIAQSLADPQPFAGEFAMIAADGRELRVAFRAEVTRDEAGQPVGAYGTVQDITERANREREEAAVREIAQLVAQAAGPAAVFSRVAVEVRDLFAAHTGAIARFDEAAGSAVLVNMASREGADLAVEEFSLDGPTASAAVYRTGLPARVEQAQAGDDPAAAVTIAAGITGAVAAPITVGGRLWGCLAVAFAGRAIPVDAEHRLGRLADLVGMAIANAEAWEALSHQATTDALTGLANRRAFEEELHAELSRARRYGRELSLVMLDLDEFKAVNDTHGHQVGDRVLAEFGRRLIAHAREGELVARIGGEEFAWLLPESDGDAAVQAAERLRSAVESEPVEGVGTVTVSAGICVAEPGIAEGELVRLADRALYAAKRAGRNAVRVHSGSLR
jgi:diguanylate cyclase (GGDEF)-like protein/PAS domain S-box-containing protein